MKAILFGSIGTIAETSEMQRAAYNDAFKWHRLDWYWQQAEYARMLERSGGIRRLEDFAAANGIQVDAAAIHETKFRVFNGMIRSGGLPARPGVERTVAWAKANQIQLGLVTTTYQNTIEAVVNATEGVGINDFSVITDVSQVEQRKPSPESYQLAMSQLGLTADQCIAIEDNVDGFNAAVAAGLYCLCFPGENTRNHSFPESSEQIFFLTPRLLQAQPA